MKHFARLETRSGLAPVPAERLPTRAKIVHQGTGQEFVLPLTWSGAGRSAVTTWSIPPAAKLGVYDGRARARRAARRAAGRRRGRRAPSAGRAATSASRSSACRWSMRASAGPKASQVAATSVAARRADELPLGRRDGRGAAACVGAAQDRARPASPATTSSRSSRRAIPRRRAAAGDERRERERRASATASWSPTRCRSRPTATAPPASRSRTCRRSTRPSRIDAELTFNDPNGEVQTVTTQIDLWPSALVLGVKAASWASNRGRVKFSVARPRHRGQADQGPGVAVRGRVSQVISTRKRLVGGFYAYDNRTDVKDLGGLCCGTTDERGLLLCEAALDAAGQVELIAEAKDAQGRAGRGRDQRLGHEARASSGSRRTTTTGSTCCRRRSATSRARPRSCRCGCRFATRPRWSRSSAKA